MMTPPGALAVKLVTLVHRSLGPKVEADMDGRGGMILTATVDRLVIVELKIAKALGKREVTYRIMPFYTTMTAEKAVATGKILVEVAGRVNKLIPVMESYVNSDQYSVAV